jgi:hypothetical protein
MKVTESSSAFGAKGPLRNFPGIITFEVLALAGDDIEKCGCMPVIESLEPCLAVHFRFVYTIIHLLKYFARLSSKLFAKVYLLAETVQFCKCKA